jgi:hypothetical protein
MAKRDEKEAVEAGRCRDETEKKKANMYHPFVM